MDLILSIPLSHIPTEDKLIWPFNPSGVYSMKSGTKFLAKESTLLAPRVNQSQHDDIWKSMMTFGKGFGDSLLQIKSRISYGVHVMMPSLSSEAYGREKSSRMMYASTVVHPLRLFAMLYGSV